MPGLASPTHHLFGVYRQQHYGYGIYRHFLEPVSDIHAGSRDAMIMAHARQAKSKTSQYLRAKRTKLMSYS